MLHRLLDHFVSPGCMERDVKGMSPNFEYRKDVAFYTIPYHQKVGWGYVEMLHKLEVLLWGFVRYNFNMVKVLLKPDFFNLRS